MSAGRAFLWAHVFSFFYVIWFIAGVKAIYRLARGEGGWLTPAPKRFSRKLNFWGLQAPFSQPNGFARLSKGYKKLAPSAPNPPQAIIPALLGNKLPARQRI